MSFQAFSPYSQYCDGYGNPGSVGNNYLTSFVLCAGVADIKFRHPGSDVLDQINAFDKAEVDDTYIGQINMITVSSFCGPQGKVWGYDVARHPDLFTKHPQVSQVKNIPVYTARPLLEASKKLFGTVTSKRFPLMPGAHVPCANKNIKKSGPVHLYCTLGLGVPEDREKNAILLMEDVGEISVGLDGQEFLKKYKTNILTQMANSILEIGENQKVRYKEIFVEIVDREIKGGQIGCGLVAAPYFSLAQNAIPNNFNTVGDMSNLSLIEWESLVSNNYLDR